MEENISKNYNVILDYSNRVAKVYIEGAIHNFEVEGKWSFKEEIRQLESQVDKVYFYVNSPGGNVFEGYAIHNIIADLKIKTIAVVTGLAASIASVLIMACDEVWIFNVAMVMIHGPSLFVLGSETQEDAESNAETLRKLKEPSINAYKERFKGSDEELEKFMSKDTWLTPDECLSYGLCDKIVTETPTQSIDQKLIFDLVKEIKSLKNENITLKSEQKTSDPVNSSELIQSIADAVAKKIGTAIQFDDKTEEPKPVQTTKEILNSYLGGN